MGIIPDALTVKELTDLLLIGQLFLFCNSEVSGIYSDFGLLAVRRISFYSRADYIGGLLTFLGVDSIINISDMEEKSMEEYHNGKYCNI